MKKDFLSVADFDEKTIRETLELAVSMKVQAAKGNYENVLKRGMAALIFHKQSLRTRCSFEVGLAQLGGGSVYITNQEIELGKRESIHDVAKVLSRYFKLICIRTFSHKDVEELAFHAQVPVINMLTDLLHPCQLMADMQTILEHKKTIDNLKIVYLGDGNNMTNSWMKMAQRIPMELVIATSPETLPDASILEETKKAGVSKISICHDPYQAVENADVLYTDVWASMGAKEQLEHKIAQLKAFQINKKLVDKAKSDVMIMHCLPAERGREITDEVMNDPRTVVFDEAENRLHAQKAIIVQLLKNASL